MFCVVLSKKISICQEAAVVSVAFEIAAVFNAKNNLPVLPQALRGAALQSAFHISLLLECSRIYHYKNVVSQGINGVCVCNDNYQLQY